MAQSVETFLVQDDRLLTTDKVRYAVLKGGANITTVPYNAISGLSNAQTVENIGTSFPSSFTWNIQVPSQEIVVGRNVLVRWRVRMVVEKTGSAAGFESEPVWNSANSLLTSANVAYGADCLNAFPMSQCIQSIQATINNSSVSMLVQDIINPLLRLYDSRDLSEYQGLCPYLVDRMGIYNGVGSGSTTFGSSGVQNAILDEAFMPRSAYPVLVSCVQAGALATISNIAQAGANSTRCVVEFTVHEPLWVSPFTWANPKTGGQGMYGLQNLAIVMNMGNWNRLIRSMPQFLLANGNPVSRTSVVGVAVQSAELILNYLTPQPSSAMVPRNCVPFVELPRYYLNNNVQLNAVGAPSATLRGLVKTTASATSNNLQLNQIPDKLIIYFEPLTQSTTGVDNLPYSLRTAIPDYYATIEGLTLNFNNQSGLLSTWTQKDLYHASRDAGSKQSWYEFTGQLQANTQSLQTGQFGGATANYDFTVGSAAINGNQSGGLNLPTTGSICILQFGKDIELPDYFAPGSIGNFNLQIQATVSHVQPFQATYRMAVIVVNSGVFINEKGTSNYYTSLLRKEDVLNASSMEPIGDSEFNRMIGGGFLDKLKSVGSSVWSVAKPVLKFLSPSIKQALSQSGNPYAQMASKAVDPLLGQGMGAGDGRLSRHMKASGYAF